MQEIKRRIFKTIEVSEDSDIAGKIFDVFLISLIILNIILVVADTFDLPEHLKTASRYLDVISVIIFTVEYLLRVWTADLLYPEQGKVISRIKYIFSFMALVDLLAVLPFYIPLLIRIDLRVLRLLRIIRLLRIFKVSRYTNALNTVGAVLKNKANQLVSSVFIVALLMVISSIIMYNVENPAQPEVFKNAFSGLWWAVSTFTTVGYGDIYPVTAAGKVISAVIALLGIGLVAVPTGIISAGFMEEMEHEREEDKAHDRHYCPHCGKKLD